MFFSWPKTWVCRFWGLFWIDVSVVDWWMLVFSGKHLVGWILRAVLDDQWNRRRWIKHFKLSLFWGDFVGAQRHVWVGLVVLWGVEEDDGGGRLRIWRAKCNFSQIKIFTRGSCWGGRCLWKRECCKSGCNMMSVMLMWVLHAKSKLVLASRSLISQWAF